MKRGLFLLLLSLFLIPSVVLADASGPSIIEYKAVVTNPNGAKDLDEDGKTIPYNTIVTIQNEYENIASGYYCKNGKEDCDDVSINLNDIMPLEKEIIPTGKESQDGEANIVVHKSTIVILNKNGAKLKKGPANAYDEYDVIVPYGTSVKITYIVSSYAEHHSTAPWYYVNDGKYRGWIDNTYSSENNAVEELGDLVVFKSTKLKNDKGNTLATFSSETILKNAYYSENGGGYYLKQNGQWGKLEGSCAEFTNRFGLTLKKINLVSANKKVLESIPFDTVIKIMSTIGDIDDDIYYYAEYNNQKGFVLAEDIFELEKKDIKKLLVKENSELINYGFDEDGVYIGEKKISSIPKNSEVNAYYEYDGGEIVWYLVSYNNKVGFIKSSNVKIMKDTNNVTPTPDVTPKVDEVTPTSVPSEEPKEEKPNNNESKNYQNEKSNNMIIYCLAGALIVSLTSIVTILLINKKKMQKIVKQMEIKKENVEPVKKEEINNEIKEDKK